MAMGWQQPRCLICRHLQLGPAFLSLTNPPLWGARTRPQRCFPEVGESGASSPAAATLLASSFSFSCQARRTEYQRLLLYGRESLVTPQLPHLSRSTNPAQAKFVRHSLALERNAFRDRSQAGKQRGWLRTLRSKPCHRDPCDSSVQYVGPGRVIKDRVSGLGRTQLGRSDRRA